jgi:3'(2'), 5'-bisphosphate nucleotidase
MKNAINPYLEQTIKIAQQAGEEIAAVYRQENALIMRQKKDASFVTEADLKAHDLIVTKLRVLTPNIPIISEEIAIPPFKERQHWEQYWCIDPLDGTHEFIHRNGEFVVSIALIKNHYPVLGVLYSPLNEMTYFAAQNEGAFKMESDKKPQKIHACGQKEEEGVCIVLSRRSGKSAELTTFLSQFNQYTLLEYSSAIKFCLVAEGTADIYPRFGPTHEWDIAAGQCIVEEAGGSVLDLSGKRLAYNTQESLKNPCFLARGKRF